jgi:hypothetical protein
MLASKNRAVAKVFYSKKPYALYAASYTIRVSYIMFELSQHSNYIEAFLGRPVHIFRLKSSDLAL